MTTASPQEAFWRGYALARKHASQAVEHALTVNDPAQMDLADLIAHAVDAASTYPSTVEAALAVIADDVTTQEASV